MPQGFTYSPSYFTQILKTDLDDVFSLKVPSCYNTYVDDLLLCSPQVSSQDDSIHLSTLLALKGHKVAKEKLQFA